MPVIKKKINLIGHCVVCLDKFETEGEISSISSQESTMGQGMSPSGYQLYLDERMSLNDMVELVAPELLKDESTENENTSMMPSGGDPGHDAHEEVEGQCSSSPPACPSCLKRLSAYKKQLELVNSQRAEIKEIIARVGEPQRSTFENSPLWRSQEVEEATKQTTLKFVDCMRDHFGESKRSRSYPNPGSGGIPGAKEFCLTDIKQEMTEEEENNLELEREDDCCEMPDFQMSLNSIKTEDERGDAYVSRIKKTSNIAILAKAARDLQRKPDPRRSSRLKKKADAVASIRRQSSPPAAKSSKPKRKRRFVCPFKSCGRIFKRNAFVKKHLESKHTHNEYCGIGFTGKSGLQERRRKRCPGPGHDNCSTAEGSSKIKE